MSIHNTVLVIGAASEIGISLATHLYSLGKNIIVTGRREEKLATLSATRPVTHTSKFENLRIGSITRKSNRVLKEHSDIDTLIINADTQNMFSFLSQEIPTQRLNDISKEVTTNLTAPMILVQHLIPFLIKNEKSCSLIFVSFGFAFIPVPYFPVYCLTKAAMQKECIALRSQLCKTNIKVVEVVHPFVDTELAQGFRKELIEVMGGEEKTINPTGVGQFLSDVMKGLDKGDDEVEVWKFSRDGGGEVERCM